MAIKHHHMSDRSLWDQAGRKHGFKPVHEVSAKAAIAQESLMIDYTAYTSLLKQYGEAKALPDAIRAHAHLVSCGIESKTFIGNSLILMYGACGCLHDAEISFQRLPFPDPCSFNCMMKVYSQNGSLDNARALFECIPQPNLYSWHMLINGYFQHGCLDMACDVFATMPHRNNISWNAMITAFAKNGHDCEALDFFHRMQVEGFEPDNVTFISALDACASLASLVQGEEIHAAVIGMGYEQDVVIGTAVLNMYGKCGCLEDALIVFDRMHHLDTVSFTAIIDVCAQNGHCKEALDLLNEMQLRGFKPDTVTFICALDACNKMDEGKAMQVATVVSGCELDVMVGTSLINMFGRCNEPHEARAVFNRMPIRNVVSWNSMVSVYGYNGYTREALEFFNHMQPEGFRPDKITLISALKACVSLAAVHEGRRIHAAVVDCGHEEEVEVGTALIDMYGKCGSLDDAKCIFSKMPQKDSITWSVLIAVSAQNGYAKEALEVFDMMQNEGIKPDKITFINVLNACSHAGQVDNGREYFDSMNSGHGITHGLEHLLCMIDLLSRAGFLQEAEEFIISSPFKGAPVAWSALLSACRLHGDLERAVRVANVCFELGSKEVGHYITLSNLYATAEKT